MIPKDASGKDAELPINLFKASDGTAITGHTFSTGDIKLALPSGTFADATVANIVEKGRGHYALQLQAGETATTGGVYLDLVVGANDWQPHAWADNIASSSVSSVDPSVLDDIATAILDADLADHAIAGSVGDAIAIAASLLQGNFFMDEVTNTVNGQTSARIRCFRTGADTTAATSGGSGEGEFATITATTVYVAQGKVLTHRAVRS